MFSNKIDTYTPVKDDKLKAQSNQNFDFEGEGFSSMLEEDETLTGKLRETEAEIMEDEAILSTDEENRAIAKRNTERARAMQQAQENTNSQSKAEVDARNVLKLMDMSNKVNMSAIKISKSKKELENLTGAVSDEPEALTDIVTKVMSEAKTEKKSEEEPIETTIDLSTSEEKMSDKDENCKDDTLHETAEELLEDASILSTDEENLAMINKAKEYKALSDNEYSNKNEDIELLDEIKSIHNQSQVEISASQKIKSAESAIAQAIEESKKFVRLSVAELSSEDVDYIINLLKEGSADANMDNDENPSALSAKFLAMIKDCLLNKKVFRIDFDNEISVIIKISVEGKISANFLTSSKELEEGLKNSLYILRQKFEEQGIKYESIEYTASNDDTGELDMEEIIKTISSIEQEKNDTLI